ncbi:hypothetical protein AB0759_30565 [Scytonema tolypothrichoides VB-61278_2]|uniref:Uncharacterized protein n=3 Tax=Cyanophyceae TaxID=3028117 RepID=A0A8S9T566_9CYAN|nr:hypothetical protein DA73_0400021000 [Tolypothrix bouteillei VB521301]
MISSTNCFPEKNKQSLENFDNIAQSFLTNALWYFTLPQRAYNLVYLLGSRPLL